LSLHGSLRCRLAAGFSIARPNSDGHWRQITFTKGTTMSRISYSERTEWKSRIEKRFQAAIDNLKASTSLDWEQVNDKAKQKAHECLGISKLIQRVEKLQDTVVQLEAEKEAIENAMYEQVLGEKISQARYRGYYSRRFLEVAQARINQIRQELLLEHPEGQQLVAFEREKEAVLDTILLASSSRELRLLWSRVTDALGESPTALQAQILTERSSSKR
jgi:hypothetical protein